MDELVDNIKTKSLTAALEPLTEQVLEISSLTLEDLEKHSDLDEILQHLAVGLRSTSQSFVEILYQKLRSINPVSFNTEITKELLAATEDVSANALLLANDKTLLEPFQDKVAKLLEVILKVILQWDKELIEVFLQAISNLRKPLIGLGKNQFLHEVLSLYKEFTKQLLELSEQLQSRLKDLVDRKIRNEFWITLSCLQKLSSSFTQVVKNIARYPLSRHIRVSKDFVVKEILLLLDELEHLLNMEEPTEGNRHAASFVSAVDDILDTLERSHLDDDGLEWKINLILQHSMTVSKFSTEDDRMQITHNCQRVLNEYRSLQNVLLNLEESPADIPLAVEILRDFLELLEQSVNHALLRMMVENLSACTDPLRNLVIRCSAKSETSGSPRDTSDLRQEVQMFDSVTERVLQTGFFALASTGDLQKIQAIKSALKMLECLEAEIVPAVYNCYLNPSDQAAQCHLQFLWRSFYDNCNHLQDSLDSIADPVAFAHVAEKILTDQLMVLRSCVYTQDVSFLEKVGRQIIATAHRSFSLLRQQDWTKNNEQMYFKEIGLALDEFRGAFTSTLDSISDLQSHRSMLKRADILLKYLMKSIDAAKRLQDSELADSVADSTMKGVNTIASTMLTFPEHVSALPIDKTINRSRNTLPRNKIGHTPNRQVRQALIRNIPIDDNTLAEITGFIPATQPWRTRCSFIPRNISCEWNSSESQSQLKPNPETFDLTDILEELTSLEGTLTSTRASETSSSILTWVSGCVGTNPSPTIGTPASVGVNTPQRLKDLQIVAQRLAALRQQKIE